MSYDRIPSNQQGRRPESTTPPIMRTAQGFLPMHHHVSRPSNTQGFQQDLHNDSDSFVLEDPMTPNQSKRQRLDHDTERQIHQEIDGNYGFYFNPAKVSENQELNPAFRNQHQQQSRESLHVTATFPVLGQQYESTRDSIKPTAAATGDQFERTSQQWNNQPGRKPKSAKTGSKSIPNNNGSRSVEDKPQLPVSNPLQNQQPPQQHLSGPPSYQKMYPMVPMPPTGYSTGKETWSMHGIPPQAQFQMWQPPATSSANSQFTHHQQTSHHGGGQLPQQQPQVHYHPLQNHSVMGMSGQPGFHNMNVAAAAAAAVAGTESREPKRKVSQASSRASQREMEQQQYQHQQLAPYQMMPMQHGPVIWSPFFENQWNPYLYRPPHQPPSLPIPPVTQETSAPTSNRPKRTKYKSASKYRGVSWHRRDRKWLARLWIGKRVCYIGAYPTELDAALAVDDAAIRAFGKDAERLNFPDQAERETLRVKLVAEAAERSSKHASVSQSSATISIPTPSPTSPPAKPLEQTPPPGG